MISYNHAMDSQDTQRKRRTYSLDPDRASDLGRVQIDISDELKRNVNRQDILDELVLLASTDTTVYNKIVKALG